MNVLICTATTQQDPGIDRVVAAIAARGGRAIRFETDRFPNDLGLVLQWDDEDRLLLLPGDETLDVATLTATWIRHADTGATLPDDLDTDLRDASRNQSGAAVWSLVECLPGFVLDPLENLNSAPYKPRQLQLARALGLEIPRTLITNDARSVRDFARRCTGGVIAKMVDSSTVVAVAEDGGTRPIYTRTLSREEIDDLDGLELCPMIFQERVPKALELRVTVVGQRVFAAAIDSAPSAAGSDDWRRDRELIGSFRPCEDLPPAVEQRLLRLLDRFGLNFATIDLILTPDGRYVFLEFNTVSYFDFIERSAGLPISESIADLLLGLAPARVPAR